MSDTQLAERNNRLDDIPVSLGAGAQIQSVGDAWVLAQIYHRAGMTPTSFKNPQQVMVALLAGSELGLPPTTSLKWIMTFGNTPVLHSDGPIGVALRSGQVEWFKNGYEGEPGTPERTAWYEIKRQGIGEPVRWTFSLAQATKAGLTNKDNWRKFDERMLFNRARAFAIRDLFSDCLGGLSIREELEGIVPPEPPEVAVTGSRGLLNTLTAGAPADDASGDPTAPDDTSDEAVWSEVEEAVRQRDGTLFGDDP